MAGSKRWQMHCNFKSSKGQAQAELMAEYTQDTRQCKDKTEHRHFTHKLYSHSQKLEKQDRNHWGTFFKKGPVNVIELKRLTHVHVARAGD